MKQRRIMPDEGEKKVKGKRRRKKRLFRIAIIGGTLSLIASVCIAVQLIKQASTVASESEATDNEERYTVCAGTVERSIAAAGLLNCAKTESVSCAKGLLITEIMVRPGDRIAAGDKLAAFDIDNLNSQFTTLSKTLEKETSGIQEIKKTDEICAPSKGRIKVLFANAGDDVATIMREYGALAILSCDGLMQVDVTSSVEMLCGDRVTVTWDNRKAKGHIEKTIDQGYRVVFPDGICPVDTEVKVMLGDEQIGEGNALIHMPIYITGTEGIIKTVKPKLNESIHAGGKVFVFESKVVTNEQRGNYDVRVANETKLAMLNAFLQDPYIYAESEGVIKEVLITNHSYVGDTEKLDAETPIIKMITDGELIITVDVNELDISQVHVGQEASITFDAFTAESFAGKVSWINQIGTRKDSLTFYNVEIELSAQDVRLFQGMSCTATITTARKDNVLLAPLSALIDEDSQTYVLVEQADGHREKVQVMTGISDGELVEITGVRSGDTLVFERPQIPSTDTDVMSLFG